jgi:hypothetical protein
LYGLSGGKRSYDGVQVFKRPDGTVTGFQVNYRKDDGSKAISDVVKVNDPNLQDKIQRIYQKISGSETAAEIQNLTNVDNPAPTPKPKPIPAPIAPDKYDDFVEKEINRIIKLNPGSSRKDVILALRNAGKIK